MKGRYLGGAGPGKPTLAQCQTHHPTTRSTLAYLRACQRQGAERSQPSDWYFRGFALVMGMALGLPLAVGYLPWQLCLWDQCPPLWPWVHLALIPVVAGGWFVFGVLLGPLSADAASLCLLHRQPLSRSVLLSSARRRFLALAGGVGALLGLIVSVTLGGSTLIGLLYAQAGVLGALASERRQYRGSLSSRDPVLCVLGLTVAATAAASLLFRPAGAGWLFLAVAALLVGSLAVLFLARYGGARLDAMPIRSLQIADSHRAAMSGVGLSLDFSSLLDLVYSRVPTATVPHGPRITRLGWSGTALCEAWRSIRCEYRAFIVANTAFGLLIASAATGLIASPFFLVPLAMLASTPLLGGLRRVTVSAGLERHLPFSSLSIRLLFSVLACLVTWVWSIAAVTAAMALGSPTLALDLALYLWLGLAAACRLARTQPPDFARGLVMTELGVVPAGALITVFRGWDVALLGAVSLAFGTIGVVACLGYVAYGLLAR